MDFLAFIISIVLVPIATDSGRVDVSPPELHLIDSCGGHFRTIAVHDSIVDDIGLRSVVFRADDEASTKDTLLLPLNQGSSESIIRVELLEGYDTAGGWVVAEDLAGNSDSLRIELEVRPARLGRDSLVLLDVGRNERRVEELWIHNAQSATELNINRLRFRDGRYFSVVNLPPGGDPNISVPPADSIRFYIRLVQGISRSYVDTLVVTIDCVDYEIPVRATLGIPLLAVTNLDFWRVLIGSEECTDLIIRNPGTDTVHISTIEVGGGEYRFDTAAIPYLPDKIPPGDTVKLPICFIPRRLGLLLGTVTFISSAADTVSVVARLVGIGVNSFNSTGFDNEGRELQVTVVPQERFLTVVSEDRSRDIETFRLYNMRGQEVQIEGVELIGDGWWQIRLASRLNAGMYFMTGRSTGTASLSVKFVVLE